jgi:curli production assembly/transport component CsgE
VLQNLVKKVTQLKTGIVEDEIQGGIILDQTKTRNGKEFYDRFTQTFDIPDEIFDYVIVIDEKPGMGTTTLISITVNDIEIYANYLQPRQDLLEESTNDAVTMATEFIKNYAQILLEMSSKEQTGTGIF